MKHRARHDYFDTIDDPFGSSFILSGDRNAAVSAHDIFSAVDSYIRSDAIAPPCSGIDDVVLADYHIEEFEFSYGALDIAALTKDENEPAYSTSEAILLLFGAAA